MQSQNFSSELTGYCDQVAKYELAKVRYIDSVYFCLAKFTRNNIKVGGRVMTQYGCSFWTFDSIAVNKQFFLDSTIRSTFRVVVDEHSVIDFQQITWNRILKSIKRNISQATKMEDTFGIDMRFIRKPILFSSRWLRL